MPTHPRHSLIGGCQYLICDMHRYDDFSQKINYVDSRPLFQQISGIEYDADSHPPPFYTTAHTSPYTAVQVRRLSRFSYPVLKPIRGGPTASSAAPDSYVTLPNSPWTFAVNGRLAGTGFREVQAHQVVHSRRGRLPLPPQHTSKFVSHPTVQLFEGPFTLTQLKVARPTAQNAVYSLNSPDHLATPCSPQRILSRSRKRFRLIITLTLDC